ncbi:LOW QUALITY PROTEIN: Adaptin ear-binding coat-associated protein 2 [Plecturocebus cupreus]
MLARLVLNSDLRRPPWPPQVLELQALNHVLNICEKDSTFDSIYLHIQISNESAIDLYRKFGFEITETKKNYSKRIEPEDAHVLQKNLKVPFGQNADKELEGRWAPGVAVEESRYESVLCVKPDVHVYCIPPRATNRGYRAAECQLDQPSWSGRLRITAKGQMAYIKLEDKTSGELFAQAPVDQFPGTAVESDHFKCVKQQCEFAKQAQNPDQGPRLDLGFKEGQTIKLNIANMKKEEGAAGNPRARPASTGGPVRQHRAKAGTGSRMEKCWGRKAEAVSMELWEPALLSTGTVTD